MTEWTDGTGESCSLEQIKDGKAVYDGFEELTFAQRFWTPYTQDAERIGQKFTVIGIRSGPLADSEDVPKYIIKFEDGYIRHGWTEEVEFHSQGWVWDHNNFDGLDYQVPPPESRA